MKIDDKIRNEKLKYDINREVTKISKLSAQTDKYDDHTDEEILPFDQRTELSYSPLRKMFQKQIKTIQNQGEKQIQAIEEHGKQLAGSSVTFNFFLH